MAGQVRLRWSSQPLSRNPDGCGEWEVAVVEVEPAFDDVGQLQLADLLAGQAWRATSATASATAGFGESSSARITVGSSGSGRFVGTRVRPDAAHGVGEDESAALENLEQRLQAVLGEVAVAGAGGQGREGGQDVVLADLGERPAPGFEPCLYNGRETLDVEFGGLGFAGAAGEVLVGIRRA